MHDSINRRDFLKVSAVAAASLAASRGKEPETIVKTLYESLNDKQKAVICFDWDHQSKTRGLLRTHVSRNLNVEEEERLTTG